MSYTPPVWDFNNTYGYPATGYLSQQQLPRFDNLSISSSGFATPQYTAPCWSPFAGDESLSPRTFNFDLNADERFADNNNTPEKEMSDGIRALLEITKNVKIQSKFEGIPYNARSQDTMSEPALSSNIVHHHQQQSTGHSNRVQLKQKVPPPPPTASFRITGLPPATLQPPAAGAKKTNYAMAVKKTLDGRKAAAATSIVYRQQPPQMPQQQEQGGEEKMAAMESPETQTWVDKLGRRTVNAKEMEGGPKINGRSVINGINLNNLKFVKPARQCQQWDKSKHRIDEPNCPLWHPRERCQYYPRCRLTAEVCGFGHPFCGYYCQCAPDKRSLQLNHLMRKDAVDMARQKSQSG